MSADWGNLEGHVIRGVFPLLRLLGSSERSAVFLSREATVAPYDVAIKLVPAVSGRAEVFLPRWRSAVTVDHPHLLRLFEVGECELGGQSFLYLVMEYADQNLAQLLEHRALGTEEVREMLRPTLDALEFLHGSRRVHGALKPSNVLVVGEQVKLASDAIGPAADVVSNGSASLAAPSAYQPPEASSGVRSTAGDVWALGVVTCEALSRRRPAGLQAIAGSIALPPDIPSPFREMISKCLRRKPEERPDIARLQAWQRGEEFEPTPAPPPPVMPAMTSTSMSAAPSPSAPASTAPSMAAPTLPSKPESASPSRPAVISPSRPAAVSPSVSASSAPSTPASMSPSVSASTAPSTAPSNLPSIPKSASPPSPASMSPSVPPSMPAPERQAGATSDAQQAASFRLVIRADITPRNETADPDELKAKWRPMRLIVAAAVLLAIVTAGVYVFKSGETPPEANAPVAATPRARSEAPPPEAASSQAPLQAREAGSPTTQPPSSQVREAGSPTTQPPSSQVREAGGQAAQAPPTQARAAGSPTTQAPSSRVAQARAIDAPTAQASPSQAPSARAPGAPSPSPSPAAPATASDSPSATSEVIPNVPRSASQTIRGTVRVSVRVIVDENGNVVAATSENPGPSRYFERLSLEAAKKWTFAPAESSAKRLMLVKFNYTRSGTTANASPVQ